MLNCRCGSCILITLIVFLGFMAPHAANAEPPRGNIFPVVLNLDLDAIESEYKYATHEGGVVVINLGDGLFFPIRAKRKILTIQPPPRDTSIWGFDRDGDGIRDDVEYLIYTNFKNEDRSRRWRLYEFAHIANLLYAHAYELYNAGVENTKNDFLMKTLLKEYLQSLKYLEDPIPEIIRYEIKNTDRRLLGSYAAMWYLNDFRDFSFYYNW